MRWDEKGYTILYGLGIDYDITEKLHVIGKYGFGMSTINREISFDNTFFDKDLNERALAIQIGGGIRYFPVKNLALGINVNAASHTPIFNFEMTAAF